MDDERTSGLPRARPDRAPSNDRALALVVVIFLGSILLALIQGSAAIGGVAAVIGAVTGLVRALRSVR